MSMILMTNKQLRDKVATSYGLDKENFKIMQKIPLAQSELKLPLELTKATQGERLVKILILACHSTNETPNGQIYEIGYALCSYIKERSCLSTIEAVGSMCEQLDPYQEVSHIDNILVLKDRLKERHFDDALLSSLVDKKTIVCVHNANVFRPLLEKRFSFLKKTAFLCSRIMPQWKDFSRNTFNTILEDVGYWIDNADVLQSALALTWILHEHPEHLKEMLIKARNSPIIDDLYLEDSPKHRLYDVSFRVEQTDEYLRHEVDVRLKKRFIYDEKKAVFHTTTTEPSGLSYVVTAHLGKQIDVSINPIPIYHAFKKDYYFND